ncbi:MAG: right-handed parallel beta-helix repeat-containing protein [Pseudomonadota bacterium]
MKTNYASGAIALALVALQGCGGGGGGGTPAPAPVPPAPVTPAPVTPPPVTTADQVAAPRAFSVQPLNANEAMLQWTDSSSDETGFQLERRSAGGTWAALAVAPANATLFRDAGLSADTSYEYRISALRPLRTPVTVAAPVAKTPVAAVQSVFYVDANIGLDSDAGTEAKPWKTIQKAANSLKPGQTVLVRAGTYSNTASSLVRIATSGTEGNWITYRNFPGEMPKLKTTISKNWNGFEIYHASYIIIDGFEIEGHVKEVDLAIALADMRTPGPYASGNAIAFENRDLAKPIAHHIIVRNNYMHDHGLGGFAGMGGDYITVENNRIYNVGATSSYGGSGISLLTPRPLDANVADYKMIIRGNLSADNSNLVPCGCYSYQAPTDGNGIILDLWKNNNYTGRALVANNLIFNNGGRGIHLFHNSKNASIDIVFNTVVKNSTIAVTGEGEITLVDAHNVRVMNNIMSARADRPLNTISSDSTNITFSNNMVYGGNRFAGTIDANRRLTDAESAGLFGAGTGIDGYRLGAASVAANASVTTGLTLPETDFFLAPRVQGVRADVGAIESH